MNKTIAALSLGTSLLAAAVATTVIIDRRSKEPYDSPLDSLLHETPLEEAFEEELGILIYQTRDISADWRNERVFRIAQAYQRLNDNWDYFPEQFASVDALFILDRDGSVIGRADPEERDIYLYCRGYDQCANSRVLLHELAHVFSANFGPNFWNSWQSISGSGYHGLENISGPRCSAAMDDVAAVTCHGAKNVLEDVADVVLFVYDVNYTPSARYGISAENIPRIEEKLLLLHRYETFSDEELHTALRWLAQYNLRALTGRSAYPEAPVIRISPEAW
ncbi:MAG: hypothetical protein Q8R53_03335 [Nanoarchaeota archaeon]|nr:hypothetical protein [Nanoarchaeota archaeon]